MSYLYGVVANDKVYKAKTISGEFYDIAPSINNALSKKLQYEMSIFQNVYCIGIHIYQPETKQYITMDFCRENTPAEQFPVQINTLLTLLLKDIKVKLFIMENPCYSHFDSWKMKIPELKNVNPKSILARTWISTMVNKSKGKNRHKKRGLIAEDICDKFPLLKPYLEERQGEDINSFNAVGILHGFKLANYDKDGNKKVSGIQEFNNIPIAFFKYLSIEEIKTPEILFKGLAWFKEDHKCETLTYNKKYSFYENIRLCSSNYELAIVMIDDPLIHTTLLWEFNIDKKDNHYFVMFVCRRSAFTKKQLASVKNFNYSLVVE